MTKDQQIARLDQAKTLIFSVEEANRSRSDFNKRVAHRGYLARVALTDMQEMIRQVPRGEDGEKGK